MPSLAPPVAGSFDHGETPPLTACHECDLLLRELPLQPGGTASCPRCGAELYRSRPGCLERALALACAALVLLLFANAFPIVGLDLQGQRIETTVFGAAYRLWQDEMIPVALVLLATTVVVPFIELGALLWLMLPLHFGQRPPGFAMVFRTLRLAHPWAMIEVFILGILVSLVKLSHLAEVLIEPALGCFGALMLVLAALATQLDDYALWQAWEAGQ